MKNACKGMSKAQINAQNLERRNALLALVEVRPHITMDEMVEKLGFRRPTVHTWCMSMVETGRLAKTTKLVHGRHMFFYERGPNMEPLQEPSKGGSPSGSFIPVKDATIKQRTVPARQIGMIRDALVAALFGPSRVVGA